MKHNNDALMNRDELSELVAKSKAGDQTAFAELYDRTSPDLFRCIALGRVQDNVGAQFLGCLQSLLLGIDCNQKLWILELCKLQVAKPDWTHSGNDHDIVELDACPLDRMDCT